MPERSYRWQYSYTTRRGRRYPTIPVSLTYLRTTRIVNGLVDSGAERSTCSAALAREAGIDLTDFPERVVRGIGGLSRARLCPIDLNILGRLIPVEVFVVEAGVVLLGRHDIFRVFQFGFDELAGLTLVEPY
jgi:hypothetical protein